jgi:phosphoglucomutase
MFSGEIKAAIAFDSRNNSKYFASVAAEILAANGCYVYLFEELRPSPELSYAVRYLNCQCGIVITASHNPKEYNGYKVYWDDGAQLVNPHDVNVIEEVRKVTSPEMVLSGQHKSNIHIISEDIDIPYIREISALSFIPDLIKKNENFSIVYTPIHGTGITVVPKALEKFGFKNVTIVTQQSQPDGNFPTVKSPNPEEKAALEMAIAKANEINAELVLATDPDADRVGIAVKKPNGEFVLLNGNQTASLLIYYLIKQWVNSGKLRGTEYIVKTIVTTELLKEIAEKHHIESFDVLTGFKYIAEVLRRYEGKRTFIGGGEESYGYLVGDFVRDKDAVIACCMIAEAAVYARENNKSLYTLLLDIYMEYGMYYESLLSVTKKGKSGADEIKQMMQDFRTTPPRSLNGSDIIMIKDYKLKKSYDTLTGTETSIDMPVSDVLQFFTADGCKITVRPSGTEPKIKFYFGIKTDLSSAAAFEETEQRCLNIIEAIKKDLNL